MESYIKRKRSMGTLPLSYKQSETTMNYLKKIILLALILTLSACGTENINKAVANGAEALSGHDLRALLSGSTIKSEGYGEEARITFSNNGRLSATNSDREKDTGTWQVDDQERLCLKFKKWGQGDKICYRVYKEGKEYKQFNDSGLLAYTFTILTAGGTFKEGISFDNSTGTKAAAQGSKESPAVTDIQQPPDAPADINFIIRQNAHDCPGCNLARAQLAGADLNNANLEGANLIYADLSGSSLRQANLRGANLYQANLKGADLSGADLTGANLTEANLKDTIMSGVIGRP